MINRQNIFLFVLLLSLFSCNDRKDLIHKLENQSSDMRTSKSENQVLKKENIELKNKINGNFQTSRSLESKLTTCNERNDLFERGHQKSYFESLIKYFSKEKLNHSEVKHLDKIFSFLDPDALDKLSKAREASGKTPSLYMMALRQENEDARFLVLNETKLVPYTSELMQNVILAEFIVRIVQDVELISEQRIYLVEKEKVTGLYQTAKNANDEISQIISISCVDRKSKQLLESCASLEGKDPVKLSKLILESNRHELIQNLIDRENIAFDSGDLSTYYRSQKPKK